MVYYSSAGDSLTDLTFVKAAARLADSAYDLEITGLGFTAPAFTVGKHYNLYLAPLHSDPNVRAFGATFPLAQIGASPTGLALDRSYMIIDNAFTDAIYFTKGYDALRITIFHEFFHMVQFSGYGTNLDQNVYFNELSSVWMEMESTPKVKDYQQLLQSYLSNLEDRFDKSPSHGYGQSIFFWYLAQRFKDVGIVREIWEDYRDQHSDPMDAIEAVLERHGSTFCREYMRFGSELFYSGKRYRGVSLLPDAGELPVNFILYHHLAQSTPGNVLGFASSLEFFIAGFGQDSCAVVVSRDTTRLTLGTGTIAINSPGNYTATYDSPDLFCDTILCSSPIALYPNPLVVSAVDDNKLHILASTNSAKPISTVLDIFSTTFEHIYHSDLPPEPFNGAWNATWNGRDDLQHMVASGIYIYTITVDGASSTGKFVVVRK